MSRLQALKDKISAQRKTMAYRKAYDQAAQRVIKKKADQEYYKALEKEEIKIAQQKAKAKANRPRGLEALSSKFSNSPKTAFMNAERITGNNPLAAAPQKATKKAAQNKNPLMGGTNDFLKQLEPPANATKTKMRKKRVKITEYE